MKKGKCQLRMGRAHCSQRGDLFCIEITDEDSRTLVVNMELSLEDALKAITSMAISDIECEYGNLNLVGKTHQTKVVHIEGLGKYSERWALRYKRAVKPYEVDGWKADIDKRWNFHKCSGHDGSYYSVTFRRWV